MPQASAVDQPPRLPLIATISTRNSSLNQDAKLVNCIAEKDVQTDEYWIQKRPGLLTQSTIAGAGNGLYNWKGAVYSVFDGTLYKNGVSLGTVDSTNGPYRWQEIRNGTLVLGNGVKAYYTDGTTLTQITDVNFPASFVKGWSYLDGTLYVMDAQAQIWGSAGLDDASTWDALNKIIARIEPDGGVALAKQGVYVIALKQWTTEVFYDAGNATGSPLGPVQGSKTPWGCMSADSVQEIDDNLVWISFNRKAGCQAAMMSNLQVQIISTAPVERILKAWDYTQIRSGSFRLSGHRYYFVTSIVSNMTLVFDLDQAMWSQWTDAAGNYWPVWDCSFDTSFNVIGQSTGRIYKIDSDFNQPTDDGSAPSCDIYTPNFDAGVDKRKHLKILRLVSDRARSSSVMQVRWSDDDYTTWNSFRSMDMSQVRPFIADLGTFYRRAFHFHHQAAIGFRVKSGDLTMDQGTL